MIITIFLGDLLTFNIRPLEITRRKIVKLHDQNVGLLDEAVKSRTEQFNGIRQTIASDIHDHTRNILAAIIHQASMLEIRLSDQSDILHLIQGIAQGTDELYSSINDLLCGT